MFGLALSVASTAVLLRALESVNGRIAVGWLIVEDLVMVLVLLPALAPLLGGSGAAGHALPDQTLWVRLAKVGAFIALMLVVGRRVFPRLERPDDPLAELPTTVDQTLLAGQVVLVGCGRVGSRIVQGLPVHKLVVAEQNRDVVECLREPGLPAVSGDATEPAVLIQAHIARAAMLVIATRSPRPTPSACAAWPRWRAR